MPDREIDLAKVRQDTPGCANVVHFNNAGAGLLPLPVLNAVKAHLDLEAQIGGYEAAERSKDLLDHAYSAIAKLIGCQEDELAVVENATRAWDMAFYSMRFAPGDRILTGMAEYASNYIAFLQASKHTGVCIDVVPDDEFGQISVSALKEMIDDRVRLIALTHVPTNGGLVNPAEEVGQVASSAGIPFLLDGCQSAGQMPIDVNKIKCDMFSATGRKYLRGPRGTGFLYVRRSMIEKLEPPFLDLHAAEWVAADKYEIRKDARRFENWETNYAGKIGLGRAVDYALDIGVDLIWDRIRSLAGRLRSKLGLIPGVVVQDLGRVRCGIVSFTVEGQDAQQLRGKLFDQGFNVWHSVRESTLMDMDARGLKKLVRASVHYYNTDDEVDLFCSALESLVRG
jgi:cysteine desulfurase/selenocysteine lyase